MSGEGISSFDYRGVTLLVKLLELGTVTRAEFAKSLNLSSVGIGKTVNLLIKDDLVIQSGCFHCPHCEKEILEIPLKIADQTIKLTEKGKKVASKLKEALDEL